MSPIRAKAAGPSKRPSTKTYRRRSSPCHCSVASTPAMRIRSRGGCWRRCGTSSAATPCGSMDRTRVYARRQWRPPVAVDVSVAARDGEILVPVQQRPAPPCVIVIFGASGDLTHRKLIPALFDLFQSGLLSKHFAVLGFSRSPLSNEDFRRTARDGLDHFAAGDSISEQAWQEFSSCLHYTA